ncbi:hypothetical protein H4582DRAFT_1894253 [Lactarius indigo]|nr:hypothetical protein H4582DRAFT_1894253 [Lactarius indigo]
MTASHIGRSSTIPSWALLPVPSSALLLPSGVHEQFLPPRARKAEACGQRNVLYMCKQCHGEPIAGRAKNGLVHPDVLIQLV